LAKNIGNFGAKANKLISKFGPDVFNFVCRIYDHLARDCFQVEILA